MLYYPGSPWNIKKLVNSNNVTILLSLTLFLKLADQYLDLT